MFNPWTGDFYWKIKPCSNIQTLSIAGCKTGKGYIRIRINKKDYAAHRLAWFYIHGYWPENDIDHEDRIKYHNWIKNLREISQQCNSRNCGNPITNTSRVKGVYWDKYRKKWHSRIMINNKNKSLGRYMYFDNAVCARLAGEQCIGWEGCDSCSPAYLYVQDNIILKRRKQ